MKKESDITPNYLAEYSDTIEALPLELQRNYTLIRQLDENAEDLMNQVQKESAALIEIKQKLSLEERRSRLEHIGQLLNEAIKKGEEKFALAKSTYDTVKHCTRLDNDLQKIEDEQLIGPGRATMNNTTTTKTTSSEISNRKVLSAVIENITERKQTSGNRKRTRKARANRNIKQDEENGLSTEDAMQHAKAAASLSDLPIDPNEPLYCYCSQVSFGEMLACDNPECEIEWFHLECVGLKTPPKGKWYCKNCAPDLKKKRKY
ncbi:uncharacterized protein BX663DRAFT_483231 [Cokeromyces recurvatus]|uniref:uncharacterized protein n=1 Tax=Cokeromyces recurvatus TaxID=90255 RepID=UPI00221F7C2B|nr:uncharacterized protein BX663DRAFT_483231 [Cokeromyces recurvatus]KAI7906496.1 hypothetical protein BX663DRAFT_483231 [Cokeromyces recurvatus]